MRVLYVRSLIPVYTYLFIWIDRRMPATFRRHIVGIELHSWLIYRFYALLLYRFFKVSMYLFWTSIVHRTLDITQILITETHQRALSRSVNVLHSSFCAYVWNESYNSVAQHRIRYGKQNKEIENLLYGI